VAVEVDGAAGVQEAGVLGAVRLGRTRAEHGVGDRVDVAAGGHAAAVERPRVRGGIAGRQVRVLRERLAVDQPMRRWSFMCRLTSL
jgi:hypothetical protein